MNYGHCGCPCNTCQSCWHDIERCVCNLLNEVDYAIESIELDTARSWEDVLDVLKKVKEAL